MESHSGEFDFNSDLEILELEDKLSMFGADEETSKNHPLNTRIHNPYQYVYKSDGYTGVLAAKLGLANYVKAHPKIINYLTDNKKYTDNEDIQVIITKIILFETLLQVIIINLRHHETMKLKNEVDAKTLEKFKIDTILQELEESESFKTKELLEVHIADASEKFIYIDKTVLNSWLDGTELIGVPAIYCVIRSLEKVLHMVNVTTSLLDEKDKSRHRKIFISMAHRMACIFDFLYAAGLDNPNDIFYQEDPENEDLKLLLSFCSFSMVEDPVKHLENNKKRVINTHEQIAIAMRGFKYKNIVGQAFSSLSWSVYYKVKKQKVWDHGTFLASILDKDALVRVFKLIQSNFMERQTESNKDLPKCEVKRAITIPFGQEDILTLENLMSEERPEMVKNDLDLPFTKKDENMDKTTHTQIRVNGEYNWSRVNWKKCILIDPDLDGIHYDGVILYIHGGGFMTGSSASSQYYTINFAKETGYPVFSLDYRLAPKYKFPCALNDCWQAYLWIVKYAKKYLKITYNKIILMGDSAGGNLCLGITALSIIKHCKIPDGLNIIYPAIACSKVGFAPSFLLSLDDVILSGTFLNTCGSFYAGNDLTKDPPALLSVDKLSNKVLKRFPPGRFVVAGNDPLRDDGFRFALKLKKQEVNVELTEFKALMHAFIGSERDSHPIAESKKAIITIINYLKELGKDDDY